MNKPFILKFVDYFKPEESASNFTEYSSVLNLNIIKGTDIPATCALNLEGETFTKANQEETDLSIKKKFSCLIQFIEGETNTRSLGDSTDLK